MASEAAETMRLQDLLPSFVPQLGSMFFGHHITEVMLRCMGLSCKSMRDDKLLLQSLKRNRYAVYEIAWDFESSYRNVDKVCFYECKGASYGHWQTQICQGRRVIYLITDHSWLKKLNSHDDEYLYSVLYGQRFSG